MVSKRVELTVNHEPVDIEGFVQQFFKAVIDGILGTLKDYRETQDIRLSIDGYVVDITLDGDTMQLNPFVSTFIKNTVTGMVSSLKDVGQIERLEIKFS